MSPTSSLAAGASFAAAAAFLLGPTAPAQTPCSSPHVVGTPLPADIVRCWLTDVEVVAADDAWAVGQYAKQVGSSQHTFTLVEHWDGSAWTRVPAPSPAVSASQQQAELLAVAAIAPNDVWAGGWKYIAFPNNGHIGPQLFVIHWDGSSWTEVPAPIPFFSYMASSSGSRVSDIVPFGPNDIWFVGHWSGDENTPRRPLAMHWDGSNFTMHVTPPSNTQNDFRDLDAIGPNDMWAVGGNLVGGIATSSIVCHYDGGNWSSVSLPTNGYHRLDAVAAIAPNDVWVTGAATQLVGLSLTEVPAAWHFDGSTWSNVPMPGFARSLVHHAADDIWAFGDVVQRWDGTSWQVVDDLASRSGPSLRGAAGSPCQMWAVGRQYNDQHSELHPLAVHVGGGFGGSAEVRLPCTGSTLRMSLLASTLPILGTPLVVTLDDPGATSGFSSGLVTWALSPNPAPGYPCGVALPGFGVGPAIGEVLVGVGTELAPPQLWNGPGQPATYVLPIPNDGALFGVTVYTQGLLLGTTGITLTAALDLTIGV